MPSFAEFLAAHVREEVILARLTLRNQETTFTAVGGGAPNTYQKVLSRFLGASEVPGGVYAPVTAVWQNDVALTARASLALVDANAGSYYHDQAAGLLYIRTTTTVDPDLFTMIAVERELALSSSGIVLNTTDGDAATGRYYHPWILSDLGSILQESEDVLQGRKIFAEGAITLASPGGFFHVRTASDSGFTWEQNRIVFSIGGRYAGQDLLRSQYVDIGALSVFRVNEVDDLSVTFGLRPLSAGPLNRSVPPTPIFATEYPRLGDTVSGTRKFVGYGRAWVSPPLVDMSGGGTYLIADAAYQTLTAVHRVEAVPKSGGGKLGLTEGVHYTVDLTACTITLTGVDVTSATHDLEVDVTGKPGLTTFGQIAQDLLQTFGKVATADIDTASFTAATALQPAELSVWITSERQLSSVFSTSEPGQPSLERSVHGTVTIDKSGKWTCKVWSPPKDTSTLAVLRKEQCAGVQWRHREERLVVGEVRVFYGYRPSQDTWLVEKHTDSARRYLAQTDDTLNVYTFLRFPANALALAQRYNLLFGQALIEADVQEMGATQLLSAPMDRVLITYAPAPASGGAFTGRVFEFVRVERLYAPMLGLSGALWDVDATGLPRNIGVWQSTGYPVWASASAAQRDASGFWTDASGDPGSGGAYVGRSKWT